MSAPCPYPWPLRFLIDGQAMSKKRNWTPLCGRGHPRIVLSAKYRAWEKGVVDQLWVQRVKYLASMVGPWVPIVDPVWVKFLFFIKGHRKIDLSNLYQGAEDALVKAGILENDDLIDSHDGSRRYYDADNPHIEITITPFYGGMGE